MCFNWYIYIAVRIVIISFKGSPLIDLQTRTLVRTEGILTQLIFEHALRIRIKAETELAAPSRQSTAAPSPDSVSIAEDEHDRTPTGSNGSTEETLKASSSSLKSAASGSSKGKQTSKVPKDIEVEKSPVNTGNLVGKINNLVSTDLNNITEARDFMFVGEFNSYSFLMHVD